VSVEKAVKKSYGEDAVYVVKDHTDMPSRENREAWVISGNSVAIDEDKIVPVYSANTFISWARQQVFTAELIPHMAAFLDFANKATEESKVNFLEYAKAIKLDEMAKTLINKAVDMGANIKKV